jgi:cobalt-zinc-cadmium efflux system membrane fusion protein
VVPKAQHTSKLVWTLPKYLLVLSTVLLISITSTVGYLIRRNWTQPDVHIGHVKEGTVTERSVSKADTELATNLLSIPKSQWANYGIDVEAVRSGSIAQEVTLTGKVSLNEDQIAHIFPMVEGAVDQVDVNLGQNVKSSQQVVVIHSREIGKAKLELYQAKLQHEMAAVRDRQQTEIIKNARELLAALHEKMPITEIEVHFKNRSMGDFRERLLLSYSNYLKSHADLERLEAATESGAISAKQLAAAQANRNADHAIYHARMEQIEYELTTSQLLTSQAAKEAETRVAVAETSLRILGCKEEDIRSVNPIAQGESISNYAIRAPFDGTVIFKDCALGEHVRPDSQILSIANLETVWIKADVYQEHVPLLSSLKNQVVTVHNNAWPERNFEAKIFFTGEIMDESTRTISMRAIADNKEHLLKPGMFVTIVLPGHEQQHVPVVPLAAIQEYQASKFVFVQVDGELFERRDIKVGMHDESNAEVLDGLKTGDKIVVNGGFVLKSKLLAELMGEG